MTLGLAIGSVLSGPIMNKGRRRAIFFACGVGILGSLIVNVLALETILCGRFF